MWLLLKRNSDPAATWLAEGLSACGLNPLVIINESALSGGTVWTQRIGANGATVVMRLSDGTIVDSTRVRGGICLLGWAGAAPVGDFVQEDRSYVQAEHWAFLVSALYCVPGLINPPGPLGLAGPEFGLREWQCRAAKAGFQLRTKPVSSNKETCLRQRVIVLDTEIFGVQPPSRIAKACLSLRAISGCRLLGIELLQTDARWEFLSASPTGDLRPGGEPLIEALTKALK